MYLTLGLQQGLVGGWHPTVGRPYVGAQVTVTQTLVGSLVVVEGRVGHVGPLITPRGSVGLSDRVPGPHRPDRVPSKASTSERRPMTGVGSD